ncbi:MAG: B12-binding domain-containing radical SAM protein [Proteobacteria bacterium]|nr:B12-binding domain-containing radical SAM protein [Pseudomonadota bacterium]
MKKQVIKSLLLYRGPQGESRDPFTDFVPIGLFNILKALLDKGVEANLVNFSKYKSSDVEKYVKEHDVDIVFISSYFGNHIHSYNLAKIFKKYHKKTYTVIGGPISILGKEILERIPHIDFVIRGEGEESALMLIEALWSNKKLSEVPNLIYRKEGQIIENDLKLIEDIDKFFFFPSELMPHCIDVAEENFAVLITSRGCPFKCNFCSSPVLWQRKIRTHSTNLLIGYLRDLRKCFGTLYFSIRDDNFLSNKKRAKEFCKLLIQEGLYYLWNTQSSAKFIDNELAETLSNAGCDQIQMGIESASIRQLAFLNKNINLSEVKEAINNMRNNLIRSFGYFITGMKESMKDIKTTLNFIRTSGLMDAVVAPLAIYPGTELSKTYPIEIFFTDREILYYDIYSYKKYYPLFLEAFEEIYKRGFTFAELNHKRNYNFKNNIVKYFAFRRNEKSSLAYLEEIKTREQYNPWSYYLLGKHFYKRNPLLSVKYLEKAGQLLFNKNKEIFNLLRKNI